MKRGNIVTVVSNGDYGKPRPALIVQSDIFSQHPSVVVAPFTSVLTGASVFRYRMEPDDSNGLNCISEVMLDKLTTVPRHRLGNFCGSASKKDMQLVTQLMAVFLGIV
ncbi:MULTISPECIES: type II toxin-antitoxin system PemK/MazF family toxin [Candidatus Williamhamiltonella]|uniref:Growth inhibitor PemK n=1 Tax=Candidatus Williamhamiltonella defendens TaxID=138072 RepID=A0A2D3TEH2_9ENTR|nr:type II toxin-antitoxin system PemK/MazF family toxin [Candidatus Hamiltonella defensa]ATW34168.1 growth inhibitor PemK [Candidatus Hamiltonella defensa]AYB48532.1 growth inhibitor PemK [Candidatus Hamiltonella defensa]